MNYWCFILAEKIHHIITVGTSIITNPETRKIPGVEHRDPKNDEHWSLKTSGTLLKLIYAQFKKEPRLFSSEINAFEGFLEEHPINQDNLSISIFTTDTNAGEFCGKIVERYFSEKYGLKHQGTMHLIRVPNFGTELFADGIRNLRNRLVEKILSLKKENTDIEIYLNGTGGFKPECAMMIFVGSLFQIPVYYMYETFRKTIMIPPIPVGPSSNSIKVLLSCIPESGIADPSKIAKIKAKDPATFDSLINMGLTRLNTSIEGNQRLEKTSYGKYYLEMCDLVDQTSNHLEGERKAN